MNSIPSLAGASDLAAPFVNDLLRDGFCVLPNVLSAGTISLLNDDLSDRFEQTPFGRGAFYGETTKRFGRLLVRSDHSKALVCHALVLAIVERLLSPYCDVIQLNTTQAIEIHPGAPAQFPHRDHDMWPAPKGDTEYLVNVIWPLTPFRAENGGTRIWPASHGRAALVESPSDTSSTIPIVPDVGPGSALIFLGSTLHAAGANITDKVRRGIVVGYSLGWLKPYENQWLAYPPEIACTFTPDAAALVGYRQHRPNLGNFEAQCPSVLLEAGADPDIPRGATDALRPDQERQIASLFNNEEHAGLA